jgi:hypothetical protein
MHYMTELNYSGRTYQLTFFKDSAESPGWMEVSSYIMPTANLTCQLNRWFLDNHASEVMARWDKNQLDSFCTALRMMGATDADFVRLGLGIPAKVVEPRSVTGRKRRAKIAE